MDVATWNSLFFKFFHYDYKFTYNTFRIIRVYITILSSVFKLWLLLFQIWLKFFQKILFMKLWNELHAHFYQRDRILCQNNFQIKENCRIVFKLLRWMNVKCILIFLRRNNFIPLCKNLKLKEKTIQYK